MLLHLQDLPDAIGTKSERSEWAVVDQTMVTQFAQLTGDEQWIHVDPERCRAAGMDGTIVHGFLLLSLIGGRFIDCFQIEGASRTINAGLDRVRFLNPVATGSSLRVWGEVVDVALRGGFVRVVYRFTIEVADADAPAAVADLVLLHEPLGEEAA